MKQIIVITLFLLGSLGVHAQEVVVDEAYIDELDSLSLEYYRAEDYVKAADVTLKLLDAIEQLHGEADSAYVKNVRFLSECYNNSRRYPKALEAAQRTVDLYGKYFSTTDARYAADLGNLGFYLLANKQTAKAIETARQALAIKESLGKNDTGMAAVLTNLAEALYEDAQPVEAVNHQLRALNIYRTYEGEHSEKYIGELAYLKRYYEAAEQMDKAEQLQERIDKLTEEAEQGFLDVPEGEIKYETAEDCHKYNNDALRCSKYILDHYVVANREQMAKAIDFLMPWSASTDDVHVVFGENEAKFLADKSTLFYGVAYIAGCTEYALRTGNADFSYEMYEYAIMRLVLWYQANLEKKYIKSNKYLDTYLKAAKSKKEDQLDKLIRKNFPTTDASKPKVEYKF